MPKARCEKLRYLSPASTMVKANLRRLGGEVCNKDSAACSPKSPALTLSDSCTPHTLGSGVYANSTRGKHGWGGVGVVEGGLGVQRWCWDVQGGAGMV